MAPGRFPEDAAVDSAVYFCYEHAADSFSGILDDRFSMSDGDIKEFIQYDNPALYRQLRELPFGSTDIPMSYYGQRSLRRNQDMHGSHPRKFTEHRQISEQHDFTKLEQLPQDTEVSKDHFTFEMLRLQLKRHVQSCLLNGYSMILRKLSPGSGPLLCDSSSCASDGLVIQGTYYLTLEQDKLHYAHPHPEEGSSQKHYCLSCLEDIFDGRQDNPIYLANRVAEAKLDGIGRDSVMKAASRLYYINRLDQGSSSTAKSSDGTQLPLNQPFELRLRKDDEINNTLVEVDKFEKKRRASLETISPASPNLLITRPPYMENFKDRYKKQGLGRWDRQLALQHECAGRSSSLPASLRLPDSEGPDITTVRICYCREPQLEFEDMVRCMNEWCLIGLFHLRCTSLDVESSENVQFLCRYCANDYSCCEPSSKDVEMKGPTAEDDLILRQADRLAKCGIESDDSIEMQVDPIEVQPSFVLTSAPRWGKPINVQPEACTSLVSSYQPSSYGIYNIASAVSPSAEQNASDQMDGFTAINTPPRNTTHQSRHPAPFINLFPGSTLTTFADLAPFITTADLTLQEDEVFDEWKHNLPPSRLVRFLMLGEVYTEDVSNGSWESNSYGHVVEEDSDDVFQDGESAGKRLSQLLLNAASRQ